VEFHKVCGWQRRPACRQICTKRWTKCMYLVEWMVHFVILAMSHFVLVHIYDYAISVTLTSLHNVPLCISQYSLHFTEHLVMKKWPTSLMLCHGSCRYCKTLIFCCILILRSCSVENSRNFNFAFLLLTAFCLSIFSDIRCCFNCV